MTSDEWKQHWQDRLAGIALRGLVFDADERPKGIYTAGQYALSLPEKVEKLLDQMWLTAQPAAVKPVATPNGAVTQPVRK